MSEHDHDHGVSDTLAGIESGSRLLVALARKRIAETLDALDDGDFLQANHLLGLAHSHLQPLASAQQSIGFLAAADRIPCTQLEAGMTLIGHGVIEDVEQVKCGNGCPGHIVVTLHEGTLQLDVGNEVYIEKVTDEPV